MANIESAINFGRRPALPVARYFSYAPEELSSNGVVGVPVAGHAGHNHTGPPLDSIAVAGLWAELIGILGYARFGAAGGDIGSHVSRYLGLDHPERVVAVHRTDAGVPVLTGDPADRARGAHLARERRGLGRD